MTLFPSPWKSRTQLLRRSDGMPRLLPVDGYRTAILNKTHRGSMIDVIRDHDRVARLTAKEAHRACGRLVATERSRSAPRRELGECHDQAPELP